MKVRNSTMKIQNVARHLKAWRGLKNTNRHLDALEQEIKECLALATGLAEREEKEMDWFTECLKVNERFSKLEVVLRAMWHVHRGTKFKETARILHFAAVTSCGSRQLLQVVELRGKFAPGMNSIWRKLVEGDDVPKA